MKGKFKFRCISFEFSAQKNRCFFSVKYASDNIQKSFSFTFLIINTRQQKICLPVQISLDLGINSGCVSRKKVHKFFYKSLNCFLMVFCSKWRDSFCICILTDHFLLQGIISNIKYIFRINGFLFNCKYFSVLIIYFQISGFF